MNTTALPFRRSWSDCNKAGRQPLTHNTLYDKFKERMLPTRLANRLPVEELTYPRLEDEGF